MKQLTGRVWCWVLTLWCAALTVFGQTQPNMNVEKVYVIFKTHLDVGFTDLSSVVTERYMTEYIPKALDVANRLKADGSGERYVWTTGSWLVWKYLQTASPDEVARLEKAIRQGDIVWNGVPYTVETETMNTDLLDACLQVSRRLDQKYGKHTLAAKMTDVPGHTRSIIAPLVRAGIHFLHVGVNPAAPLPAVPEFCRWRDPDGNEIILAYQQDYGTECLLPGGKCAVSVNFTGDNHGPHTYEQVKAIYADLRRRYPKACLVAASFNEVAGELLASSVNLPVVTSEIGDTWIYGYGSAPIRMAKFRVLQSLYAKWVKAGKLNPHSDEALNFALELGLIAEHTQGMDVKTHLRNWDKYDMDAFVAARSAEAFRRVEQSWQELDDYVLQAIHYLPPALQEEAYAAIRVVDTPWLPSFSGEEPSSEPMPWTLSLLEDGILRLSGLSYRMYDAADYSRFFDNYLRARYDWALKDYGKPGLDQSAAVSAAVSAQVVWKEVRKKQEGTDEWYELAFPADGRIDARVYPEKMYAHIFTARNQKRAEVELTVWHKPAVRLPESYWLSFQADDVVSLVAEKVGQPVDLLDVVENGNRQMHGVDRYVDIVTSGGTVRVWSETAFLVSIGEARGLNFSTGVPDKQGGIHFNLSNNLWGTNFSMWNEGSLTYRFVVECI